MERYEDKIENIYGIKRKIAYIYQKITKKTLYLNKIKRKKLLDKINLNDICLSVGGDNYCYNGQETLGDLNRLMLKKGARTVLWGCSVDESMVNENIKNDLKSYSLIIAR